MNGSYKPLAGFPHWWGSTDLLNRDQEINHDWNGYKQTKPVEPCRN